MISGLPALMLCASLIVHDGDSLRCNGVPIRLAAIDAPEMRGSPACFGAKARSHDYRFDEGERSARAMLGKCA